MITITIKGGLGNQMFQYAAARSLAEKHACSICIDIHQYEEKKCIRPFDLDKLQISANFIRARPSPHLFSSYYVEKSYCFNEEVMRLPDNSYLEGYFESELYFNMVEDTLRNEFVPRDSRTLRKAQNLVAPLRSTGKRIVSIHVRRGDFLTAFPQNVLKAREIKRAIEWFGDCVFLVFSDDLAWCEEHLSSNNIYFCSGASNIEDLFAMSMCDGHIISHSSFSWWGAWLNRSEERVVLMPSGHFLQSNKRSTKEVVDNWVLA